MALTPHVGNKCLSICSGLLLYGAKSWEESGTHGTVRWLRVCQCLMNLMNFSWATVVFLLKGPNYCINRSILGSPSPSPSPVPSCTTTRNAPGQQMSLSAVLLVSLFFFSSLAVAQISAPPCSTDWNWVCTLSFPHHFPWPLPDLMTLSSSRSILSGKVHV